MTDDVAAVRLRLAQIVAQAEADETFRKRLTDDPGSVFTEYRIPEKAVEEYSQVLAQVRAKADGCSDFTCISSECGPTCYITIPIFV
ncbi:hypothetical protein [Kitasatospora sp. DSM 101779]|uniref:hypothetical protein n=1 Tax=Kitasatospora sp. DSM 101779 TaxID=2853165 RepID=UPI0021D914DE|nr:hypothetical protein [Kitasatospora sp. DSM 101779]MCU7820312.1 hypothetical protein [Kitasatospora sp. DSM 101779]